MDEAAASGGVVLVLTCPHSARFASIPLVVFVTAGSRRRYLGGLLETVLRRLGDRFGASWGPPGGSFGPLGGPLGASWGPWGLPGGLLGPPGASWGPWGLLGGLLGPPGALSWSRLGGLFGRLGGLLGCLGALLGCLGAVLGASWAILGQSCGPLGRSWSVGKPKSREPQKPSKTNGKAMIFASWGPLGRPLGGLLGRLGGLLGRLGAILGVLERSFVGSGPFSIVWTAPRGGLGPFLAPRGREERPRG